MNYFSGSDLGANVVAKTIALVKTKKNPTNDIVLYFGFDTEVINGTAQIHARIQGKATMMILKQRYTKEP
jgi:hypothetical protein